MNKTCPKCGSIRIVEAPSGDVNICLACESFFNNGKSKPTLFDRIIASPEVLAPNFVYCEKTLTDGYIWYSLLLGEIGYSTESEAFEATVAKLKEVER